MGNINNKLFSTLAAIPHSVWALGFVSLFMDISSDLIHSVLPVFMVSTLGASMVSVGIVEGIAESTALIVKIFSGMLSDYLQRRKVITAIGYSMAAFTKPLFPVAQSISVVLTARFLDRIGKGIRDVLRNGLALSMVRDSIQGLAGASVDPSSLTDFILQEGHQSVVALMQESVKGADQSLLDPLLPKRGRRRSCSDIPVAVMASRAQDNEHLRTVRGKTERRSLLAQRKMSPEHLAGVMKRSPGLSDSRDSEKSYWEIRNMVAQRLRKQMLSKNTRSASLSAIKR